MSLTSKEKPHTRHNTLVLFAKESLNYLNKRQKSIALTFDIQNFSSSQEYNIHLGLVSLELLAGGGGTEGAHSQRGTP